MNRDRKKNLTVVKACIADRRNYDDAMNESSTHESLVNIVEGDLVQRLLTDQHWRSRLLGLHGIPKNARNYPEVLHDDLGRKGDIDILVVDPAQPQFATGIQVKRIKVSPRAFQTGEPNKLTAIAELHAQSNRLVDLGFWQVFSYALVVVDSRKNNHGEFRYDGLTPRLRSKIDESLTAKCLHQNAGFVRFDFVQPINDFPLGVGTFSSRVLRSATVQQQSASITAWVSSKISEHDD